MVRDEWLTQNRAHNDVPARLADSGKAWGDKEDPEEVEERIASIKEEKGRNKKRKAATTSEGMNKKKGKKGKDKEKEGEKETEGQNIEAQGVQEDRGPSSAGPSDGGGA